MSTLRPVGCFALFATLASPSWALPAQDSPESAADAFERIEQRANEFTSSSQDRVALDMHPRGGSVLVWHSRRQEEGGYGVYARRYDAAGQPTTGEVHVNHTTRSMQTDPAVAVDGEGGIWIAWRSFGQDGDGDSIVARRFDADLKTATPEVLVNEQTAGDQNSVALAALPDGGALVVWTTPGAAGARSEVHMRRLAPTGTTLGAESTVDAPAEGSARIATVRCDAGGRSAIAWSRTDSRGLPAGVWLRRYDAEGRALEAALRIDSSPDGGAIEPALELSSADELVVAWLQSEGDGYGIRMRDLRFGAEGAELGEITTLVDASAGYTSGLALALASDGRRLLCWSRYGDGEKGEAGLFARLYDAENVPLDAAFRVTQESEGRQRLAAATGTRRVAFDTDGNLAFAWTGNAGLGDSSGAHMSLLRPEDATRLAGADESASTVEGPSFDELGEAARPHDPPTFEPGVRPERIPDIALGAGGDLDFLAISNTGWTPPDPHLAVGINHLVCMTNGEIAFFDKNGNQLFSDQIEGGGGFWGAQGATGFVFDPETVWDPHAERFIAMACERGSNGRPYYLLAISDDANPVGTWHKYRIDVLTSAGDDDIDSPNLGVDENTIYLSADFFGPDMLHMLFIDKASVLGGGAISFQDLNIGGVQSQGLPVNHDTGSAAHYMIGFNFGTSSLVRLYALTNVSTAPVSQTINITVPSYSQPQNPPQAGTSVRPEMFEARFWNCVYRDGSLWATHHVNDSRVRQRWYEFDMRGWPTSGQNPVLAQSGEIDLGGSICTYFGSIAVDGAGNMGMTYARSSPSELISMERTYRLATDAPGTTRPGVQVRPSTASDTSGRWGDYSQTVDDPVDPSTFWGIHEYRTSAWQTRVYRASFCDASTSSYCVAAPNSVGSGMLIGSSGSTSITADDFGLFASPGPNGQFGLFFFGSGQQQTAFGNGFLCVQGSLTRLPILTIDSFGIALHAVDYSSPAGSALTAGSEWNFQFWYRDPAGGGAFFNTSDALNARFCP